MYKSWFRLVLWYIDHCRLFNAKSSLYVYIWMYKSWFGLVLWYIDHCRLFNAKSSLYVYSGCIRVGLFGFMVY